MARCWIAGANDGEQKAHRLWPAVGLLRKDFCENQNLSPPLRALAQTTKRTGIEQMLACSRFVAAVDRFIREARFLMQPTRGVNQGTASFPSADLRASAKRPSRPTRKTSRHPCAPAKAGSAFGTGALTPAAARVFRHRSETGGSSGNSSGSGHELALVVVILGVNRKHFTRTPRPAMSMNNMPPQWRRNQDDLPDRDYPFCYIRNAKMSVGYGRNISIRYFASARPTAW